MLAADEYICTASAMRRFIEQAQAVQREGLPPAQLVKRIRGPFTELMADQRWLPDEFAQPGAQTGMGGGIATWLLFRAGDGSLSFSALVVPPGATTPVHDHLVWGLVGLYRGEQAEVMYARTDDGAVEGHADLVVAQRNQLKPGDLYELLPPDGDIHSVSTSGTVPSVSLHLLAADIGCILRHSFDPDQQAVRAFKSGWANAPCPESEE
jgi:predicted metal-dependent enzyme (double-stranded beta helix superfamily)